MKCTYIICSLYNIDEEKLNLLAVRSVLICLMLTDALLSYSPKALQLVSHAYIVFSDAYRMYSTYTFKTHLIETSMVVILCYKIATASFTITECGTKKVIANAPHKKLNEASTYMDGCYMNAHVCFYFSMQILRLRWINVNHVLCASKSICVFKKHMA